MGKKNFFINNSVEALIALKEGHQGLETAWTLMGEGEEEVGSRKLQKYTPFAYSWSTTRSEKPKDAIVPNQLLAANADTVAYQMEKYENSGLVGIL